MKESIPEKFKPQSILLQLCREKKISWDTKGEIIAPVLKKRYEDPKEHSQTITDISAILKTAKDEEDFIRLMKKAYPELE